MDLLHTFILIGAVQGIILAAALASIRRGNLKANRILAVTLCCFAAANGIHALPVAGGSHAFPVHFETVAVLYLVINPLLLLYVRAMTGPGYRVTMTDVWHFAIPTLGMLGLLALAVTRSGSADRDAHSHAMGPAFVGYGVALILQTVLYLSLSLSVVRRHAISIANSFSNLERINLVWLRSLLLGYAASWLLGVILDALPTVDRPWDYVSVVASVFMYAIGYMALRQPQIFTGDAGAPGKAVDRKNDPKQKYERSALDEERARSLATRLATVLQKEHLYLSGEMKAADLAQRLGVSTHILSQVINEQMGRTFFDLINGYRVEEAKRRLSDPANAGLNISSIAFDVGFNSMSAFNAAFKRHAGTTPSRFRRSAAQEPGTES